MAYKKTRTKKQEVDEIMYEDLTEYHNSKKINNTAKPYKISNKELAKQLIGSKLTIKSKNKKQKDYLNIIEKNEITLCAGSAGVGKSYISIAKALELIISDENTYNKIYIMTPIVEAEDNLGFLKGSLDDKIFPYLYSTYYIIDKLVGRDVREKLVSAGVIEPTVLTYMRGVNIDDSIMISEESQNISKKGMKLLLSRIGYNSKFIISGDLEQCDKYKDRKESGLYWAIEKLVDIDNVGTIQFEKEDIIRNPLITKILDKLDN